MSDQKRQQQEYPPELFDRPGVRVIKTDLFGVKTVVSWEEARGAFSGLGERRDNFIRSGIGATSGATFEVIDTSRAKLSAAGKRRRNARRWADGTSN